MILNKVRRTINEYGMLRKGDVVVVAVSGGADSTAMLSLLSSLREELGISLHLAHLNHMLRGEEAEKDALYVRELSVKFGLPVTVGKKDVPALIKRKKVSPEEGARWARYDFLRKVAREVKSSKIAVGSTADDQAETILMRFLRGSGLKGLTGIAPFRSLGDSEFSPLPGERVSNFQLSPPKADPPQAETFNSKLYIIRPLLEVSRSDIEDYLEKTGLRWRVDASNREPIYLRNRIRQELLPHLAENYNPHIKSILSGMARVLQSDEDYLSLVTGEIFPEVARAEGKQRIIIDIERLKALHLSMQRRILRKGIESVKGNLRGISLTQLDDVLDIISNQGSSEIHLPRDVVISRSYGNLVISGKRKGTEQEPGSQLAGKGIRLKVPGETEFKELNLKVRCSLLPRDSVRLPGKGSLPETGTAYFDFDKVRLPLLVRYRRRGDSFQPLGMKGRKKLKDFFIDRKIPREERDKIPLLVQGEDILWVIGHRQGGKAKVTGKTEKVLRIRIHRTQKADVV